LVNSLPEVPTNVARITTADGNGNGTTNRGPVGEQKTGKSRREQNDGGIHQRQTRGGGGGVLRRKKP